MIFTTTALPGESLFITSLQNSGHGLAMCFAAFLGITTLAWKSPSLTPRFYVIVPAALIVLSVLIEAIQFFIGRSASISDIIMDTAGIIAGVCLSTLLTINAWPSIKKACLCLSILLLAYCIRMPTYYFIAEQFSLTLPKLANFDNFAPRANIRSGGGATFTIDDHTTIWPSSTSNSMLAVYSPGKWPYVRITDSVQDWTNYEYLAIDVFNHQNTDVQLNIRVDYTSTNQSDRSFMVARRIVVPGHSTVDISYQELTHEYYGREPYFSSIEGVMLYVSNPERDLSFYFDNITLHN